MTEEVKEHVRNHGSMQESWMISVKHVPFFEYWKSKLLLVAGIWTSHEMAEEFKDYSLILYVKRL